MGKGKAGLDYFPLDVDFFNDEKIEIVCAKHGTLAELVTIKLLARIYRNGYYIGWDEDAAYLYAKKFGGGITFEFLSSVVEELINRGFFSADKFRDYHILTSRGIQKRYLEATKRRKYTEMASELLLLSEKDVNIINGNVNILSKNVNMMYTLPPENVNSEKQSKVKYSKESKVKKTSSLPPSGGNGDKEPYPPWLNKNLWSDFLEHRKDLKPKLTPKAEELAIKKLKTLMDDGDDQQLLIEQTIENGWKSFFPLKAKKEISKGDWMQRQNFAAAKAFLERDDYGS